MTIIIGIVVILFSIGCGLYYITEVLEEYRFHTIRRCLINRCIGLVVIIHLLCLLFTPLPSYALLVSISFQLLYWMAINSSTMLNASRSSFLSPSFLLTSILAVINHFLWFNLFNTNRSSIALSFSQISAVFTLLVWFIPFIIFISLTGHDHPFDLPS